MYDKQKTHLIKLINELIKHSVTNKKFNPDVVNTVRRQLEGGYRVSNRQLLAVYNQYESFIKGSANFKPKHVEE